MTNSGGIFPFGQPLRRIEQTDRSAKKVFVLGVYASALHARWVGANDRTLEKALAVASEPAIFWRGDHAGDIISRIKVPPEVAKLVAADAQFNGPSGIALDDCILKPLGLGRNDAWLCDLVPYSCMNAPQQKAISLHYAPLIDEHRLPLPSIPAVPTKLADDVRRQEILNELIESKAHTLILLGDKPLEWFLKNFDPRWRRLSDFEPYGALHRCAVGGLKIDILPLAHHRQVARLGKSSAKWFNVHQEWMKSAQPLEIANDRRKS